MDADLAIVDLDARWQVTADSLATSAGYSIYEGQELRGRVVHTLSRGRFVLRDGRLSDDSAGHGRYQRRRLPG
jgi:dihydropyrimidinase/allantoinase